MMDAAVRAQERFCGPIRAGHEQDTTSDGTGPEIGPEGPVESLAGLRAYVKRHARMDEMTKAALQVYAREIEREVDEMWHALTIDAKPMTDENMAESGWMRLPLDADGVPIHLGDVMETDNGIRKVDVLQKSSRKWSVGLVPVGGGVFSWHDAETLRHHHAPTVEDVLREFFSRYVTTKPKDEDDAIIAEYAAKLRMAGDE